MTTSPYVSRINQIDASQLDNEIYNIAKQQSSEILKLCAPGVVGKWQPEIDALLKVAIWNYSLRIGNSSFGQQLLNLHYDKYDKRKAVFYILLTVLPSYIQERINNGRMAGNTERNNRIKRFVEWTATATQLLSLMNLLLFLNRGNQPNIVEIILGIKNRPTKSHKPRNIGYSYMTRELLWHSLIELFTIVLPMINIHFIKQRIKRIFLVKKTANGSVTPQMEFHTKCPECDQTPNLPRHAGCEHIFCYYCIKARFTIDEFHECPACGVQLHSSRMKTV